MEREEISRDEAKARFEAEDEPYKVELVDTAEGDITLYTQGDFTDLCRGPHLQNSKPIKAFKLTGLAGAYWRGDEHNKQLTRIYGTAFYSQADLDAYLERLEQARARDHRQARRAARPLPPRRELAGLAVLAPEGDGDLERARGLCAGARTRARGYVEVKTPLIYDKALWERSGHWEKFRENMFLIPRGDDHTFAIKPMNCPGHMLLFAHTLRSYRELPLRYAEAAPLHRNERAGTLHGLTRVRHVTQDDAHIFCTARADRGRDLRLPRLRDVPLRPLRARGALRALDPARQQARHRRGVGLHRGRAARGARPARHRRTRSARATARSTGRRSTCT